MGPEHLLDRGPRPGHRWPLEPGGPLLGLVLCTQVVHSLPRPAPAGRQERCPSPHRPNSPKHLWTLPTVPWGGGTAVLD